MTRRIAPPRGPAQARAKARAPRGPLERAITPGEVQRKGQDTSPGQGHAPARGRPAMPVMPPFAVVERMIETYGRDGDLIYKTMYVPAHWPPDASRPVFFPADPRTPYASRGKRRWRMFASRYQAVRWLLGQQTVLVAGGAG